MQEFLSQYGILIVIGLVVLYLLTKGRRHLSQVKADAKDAAFKAAMREIGLENLPDVEKVKKIAGIATAIRNANPKKIADKAIDVLAEEVAKIPERDIPALVDEKDDIDGLGVALNRAIKAEEKREKAKRGFKKVVSIGAKILKLVI